MTGVAVAALALIWAWCIFDLIVQPTIVRGICRCVILTKRWAVKVPTTRPYGRRGDRLTYWCRGVQANLSERQWSAWPGVCPVKWAFLGGIVQVYPRAEPVDRDEWEPGLHTDDIEGLLVKYRAVAPGLPFGDHKPENLGMLDGRVVWLDYDSSWNGCPHAPWNGQDTRVSDGVS